MGTMISSLTGAAETTDNSATDALFSALYSELHRLAKRELARQWSPLGMSVTTLLHEAYLDMVARNGSSFPDHARFMGYAARVMRGLIIDHARSHSAIKRGGEFEITSLETDVAENPADAKELSLISDALDQLAKIDPELAAGRRFEVLLRLLLRRNCCDAEVVRTYRAKKVGEGAHLSPSQHLHGSITLRKSMSILVRMQWHAVKSTPGRSARNEEEERSIWLSSLRAQNPCSGGTTGNASPRALCCDGEGFPGEAFG